MNRDLDTLARTIFGEARGETMEGRVAVANVILNRFRVARAARQKHKGTGFSHLFGNGSDIASTCLRKWQFSCWNDKDPNRKIIERVTPANVHFAECIVVAKLALAGLLVDNTNGSRHYHTTIMGLPESWIPKGELPPTPTVIIGAHTFYNNVK